MAASSERPKTPTLEEAVSFLRSPDSYRILTDWGSSGPVNQDQIQLLAKHFRPSSIDDRIFTTAVASMAQGHRVELVAEAHEADGRAESKQFRHVCKKIATKYNKQHAGRPLSRDEAEILMRSYITSSSIPDARQKIHDMDPATLRSELASIERSSRQDTIPATAVQQVNAASTTPPEQPSFQDPDQDTIPPETPRHNTIAIEGPPQSSTSTADLQQATTSPQVTQHTHTAAPQPVGHATATKEDKEKARKRKRRRQKYSSIRADARANEAGVVQQPLPSDGLPPEATESHTSKKKRNKKRTRKAKHRKAQDAEVDETQDAQVDESLHAEDAALEQVLHDETEAQIPDEEVVHEVRQPDTVSMDTYDLGEEAQAEDMQHHALEATFDTPSSNEDHMADSTLQRLLTVSQVLQELDNTSGMKVDNRKPMEDNITHADDDSDDRKRDRHESEDEDDSIVMEDKKAGMVDNSVEMEEEESDVDVEDNDGDNDVEVGDNEMEMEEEDDDVEVEDDDVEVEDDDVEVEDDNVEMEDKRVEMEDNNVELDDDSDIEAQDTTLPRSLSDTTIELEDQVQYRQERLTEDSDAHEEEHDLNTDQAVESKHLETRTFTYNMPTTRRATTSSPPPEVQLDELAEVGTAQADVDEFGINVTPPTSPYSQSSSSVYETPTGRLTQSSAIPYRSSQGGDAPRTPESRAASSQSANDGDAFFTPMYRPPSPIVMITTGTFHHESRKRRRSPVAPEGTRASQIVDDNALLEVSPRVAKRTRAAPSPSDDSVGETGQHGSGTTPVPQLLTRTRSASALKSPSTKSDIPGTEVPRKKVRFSKATSPYFPSPSPQKRSQEDPTAMASPSPRKAGVSCLPFPPVTQQKFGLLQEQVWQNPFRLLVLVCFLNKTAGAQAIHVFHDLMDQYPTAEALAQAQQVDVTEIIKSLGLQVQRALTLVSLAQAWVHDPPQKGRRHRKLNYPAKGDGKDIKCGDILDDDDPRSAAFEIAHLPGAGPYALDAWRIFCRDVLRGVASGYNGEDASSADFEPEWKRVVPADKELKAFLRWMWLKEGIAWDPDTGARKPAAQDDVGPPEVIFTSSQQAIEEDRFASSQSTPTPRFEPVVLINTTPRKQLVEDNIDRADDLSSRIDTAEPEILDGDPGNATSDHRVSDAAAAWESNLTPSKQHFKKSSERQRFTDPFADPANRKRFREKTGFDYRPGLSWTDFKQQLGADVINSLSQRLVDVLEEGCRYEAALRAEKEA